MKITKCFLGALCLLFSVQVCCQKQKYSQNHDLTPYYYDLTPYSAANEDSIYNFLNEISGVAINRLLNGNEYGNGNIIRSSQIIGNLVSKPYRDPYDLKRPPFAPEYFSLSSFKSAAYYPWWHKPWWTAERRKEVSCPLLITSEDSLKGFPVFYTMNDIMPHQAFRELIQAYADTLQPSIEVWDLNRLVGRWASTSKSERRFGYLSYIFTVPVFDKSHKYAMVGMRRERYSYSRGDISLIFLFVREQNTWVLKAYHDSEVRPNLIVRYDCPEYFKYAYDERDTFYF